MDAETQILQEMDIQDVLREAVNNGILRVDEIAASVERMKREQLLSQHSREIWQDKKGMYLTYIYDENGKRKIRRRKTKEELENYLVKHRPHLQIIYIVRMLLIGPNFLQQKPLNFLVCIEKHFVSYFPIPYKWKVNYP